MDLNSLLVVVFGFSLWLSCCCVHTCSVSTLSLLVYSIFFGCRHQIEIIVIEISSLLSWNSTITWFLTNIFGIWTLQFLVLSGCFVNFQAAIEMTDKHYSWLAAKWNFLMRPTNNICKWYNPTAHRINRHNQNVRFGGESTLAALSMHTDYRKWIASLGSLALNLV